ncbi:NEAT domain-containing protein [Faecalibacillus faecis]|uniref:NEAT domain-containing protein n=1 Tax=Faecalibacillus faecis TaxID=1982628 RepID=UPI003AB569AB
MKKILKIALALMMALGLQLTSLNAVNALNSNLSKVGTYQIPIKSLTSSAPMPVVKKAFANAFGDTLEVTVDKDGKMQAVATLQNMIINMGSEYYANVLTISNGTTLSTKVEKYTQGMNGPTVETEVPEKISFELTQLDENNSTVLPVTVDFMNTLMGNGKDYPTNVSLTLDLENAKVLQKEYTLEDGTYDVPVDVLKENSDDQSMAAKAIDSAQLTVKNNEVVVTLKLKEMTIYGQTASVDKMEYQLKDGTYKEVTVIEEENGHPTKVQFRLDENKELINVNFYYGGSSRASTARLQLKLDGLTKVDSTPETPKNDNDDIKEENKKEEEVTTRFSKDGTYEVNVALWNATNDKESMAAGALNNKAKIIVKDGKATMYISTKEMTFGTIKASLQEFYIGNSSSDYKNHSATIIEKDAQGHPTLWSFVLPHENEYIDVMMNPHVAMMGNMDLGARIKVDYTTLTYVSTQTELETNTGNNQKENNSVENTNSKDQTTTNNQTNENKVVKTGDQTAINIMAMLLIISSVMTGVILRKKHEA